MFSSLLLTIETSISTSTWSLPTPSAQRSSPTAAQLDADDIRSCRDSPGLTYRHCTSRIKLALRRGTIICPTTTHRSRHHGPQACRCKRPSSLTSLAMCRSPTSMRSVVELSCDARRALMSAPLSSSWKVRAALD